MAVDFNTLIAQNRRSSVLLAMGMTVLLCVLGAAVGYMATALWGGAQPDAIRHAVILGIVVAAVLAAMSMTGSYFLGASAVLGMSHAHRIEKQDDPQLFNVVEEMAIAAGVPMPKVYLIDDTAPNAFATGRNAKTAAVAITTGLRTKLTRDELQGVMAHEMSHVRNLDILFAMLMATMVGVIVLLCDFLLRSFFYGGMGRGRSRSRSGRGGDGGGGAVVLVLVVVGLLLAVIAPLIAKFIQLAVSRQREYLADASAVELTRNPDGLIEALRKISSDKEVLEVANRATQHLYIVNPIKPFEARASSMFNTHPPIPDRIARLQQLKTG
jgi:heat shock protein HtpX